jgi:hypothetical protein
LKKGRKMLGETPLFGKGAFTLDPNMTPQQIATRRALMKAIAPRFGSAEYAGEGMMQLATGLMMGAQNRHMNQTEGVGSQKATGLFADLMGKVGPGFGAGGFGVKPFFGFGGQL